MFISKLLKLEYLFIIGLLFLSGCGTAKSIIADSKKQVCEDTCRLKFSKYDYNPLNTCILDCERKRTEDVKSDESKKMSTGK